MYLSLCGLPCLSISKQQVSHKTHHNNSAAFSPKHRRTSFSRDISNHDISCSFMTYYSGCLPNFYQNALKLYQNSFPLLYHRASTESCVTNHPNKTRLFQVGLRSFLVMIKLYFQKFFATLAIHSSVNE